MVIVLFSQGISVYRVGFIPLESEECVSVFCLLK